MVAGADHEIVVFGSARRGRTAKLAFPRTAQAYSSEYPSTSSRDPVIHLARNSFLALPAVRRTAASNPRTETPFGRSPTADRLPRARRAWPSTARRFGQARQHVPSPSGSSPHAAATRGRHPRSGGGGAGATLGSPGSSPGS